MYVNRERRTQAERRAATRAALIDAARALFTQQGFAVTTNDEIAARAGVTRGALYHHFDSKADIALAVIERLDTELLARAIAAGAKGKDPQDRLRRSCRAYIDACAEPDIARLLAEAPAILSIEDLHRMNEATCGRLLEGLTAEGLDLPGDGQVGARLLLALLDEAAFIVAADPTARRRVRATVDDFVERLLDSIA